MHRFPSILSSLRFNGADVRGDLEFCTNDNSVSGDVSYTSGDNEVVARVNSASSNVVESVEVTRKQASNGLNFLFRPKYNVADKNLEIETSADLDENTNLFVKVSQQGSADFEVDHRLDSDTRVLLRDRVLYKFCLLTTVILRLPDKRLPDGRRRLPASGRHCGMRTFISAIGRRLCVPGPLLCLSAGACVFLAGYEARSHN